ncbi:hypothetical protein GCM10010106_22600 [Thermopolyspora flexuosa]|uniref:Uncharacterized protein DUF2516 n=1 Tax=Thermopolyspora flexuosa TaxID=103836 RepID=A0A543J2W1_9ACTN|nr:DUF2516 family protein [Thermopolyspora flexuosa]TQM77165.1 uncharacterized protein DUF2516 [Thermopolyspora flexuosa]GGM75573.1 hypothetical protein GCM10010106_22600 [Thermopolyspora flexuosa]
MLGGIHSVLDLIFWLLSIGAFVLCVWALVHAIRTPARNFAVAGKLTKNIWLAILGFATLFTFAAAALYLRAISILNVAAVIAAGVYLADVKPAVSGQGRNEGPYGPW